MKSTVICVLAISSSMTIASELSCTSEELRNPKSPVQKLIHSASEPTLSKHELYKKIAREIALEEHRDRRRSDTLPPIVQEDQN